MNFWENKPLKINKTNETNIIQLYTNEKLLDKINSEITLNKIQLDYAILSDFSDNKLNSIVSFLNKNYITSDNNNFKLIYTLNLFKFYSINSLIIEFYPKKSKNIIGYIIGKKEILNIHSQDYNSIEVNFLCILPKLRKLGITPQMINILTRESILKYNIGIAHYTIFTHIKSPHFSQKYLYHIPINIDNLIKSEFLHKNIQRKIFNEFNYDKKLSIEYHNPGIASSFTTLFELANLYERYINYCKKTYYIYENINKNDFLKTFYNDDFYHFVIKKNNIIISYICIFKLDTINTQLNNSYKNGYLYYMFFEELELVHDSFDITLEYIYKHNIFDIITFSDISLVTGMNKIIPGNGLLKYFLFNVELNLIENHKNGLITI